MNNTNNSVKLSNYRTSYILAGVFFVMIFAICVTLFSLTTKEAANTVLNALRTTAYVMALAGAVLVSNRCSKANKIKNPDIFIPPRDMFYYIKRMGFITVMIVLMSVAASLIGMCVIMFFGGLLFRVENLLLRELVVRIPLFILYLSFVYKMLVRFGFMDSQRKIFNANLKMLAVILALIMMLPGTMHDSFFYIPAANAEIVNVQTVLAPNVGAYIVEEDGYGYYNENFNAGSVVLIAFTVILTCAIQAAVFWFAYNRGKKIFIRQHIREVDEYEMNENI